MQPAPRRRRVRSAADLSLRSKNLKLLHRRHDADVATLRVAYRRFRLPNRHPGRILAPSKKTGGRVMTSRLAFYAAVATTVFCVTGINASAQTYEVTRLVPGSAFHGVHGLGIDKSGRLFAGSVAGAALYEVDRANGTARIAIPSPEGMADDIAIAPDGTMAWTGFLTGDLYARKNGGPLKKLASGLPGINSLAYRKDGRLYATQVFLGDALYEIDTAGVKPPHKIMEKMGGLNGFEFGPDDRLYGPLWFKGQVASVDVDKG